jgi:hypothetical protein
MPHAVPSPSRKSLRNAALFLCRLACLLVISISHLRGQALPAGEVRAGAGIFFTGNMANTQLTDFADNALGFNAGLFLQHSPLLGIEGRIADYPLKATFSQAPVTLGLRVAPYRTRPFQPVPFAFFGGGYSRSQYAKVNGQPSVALWAPCWQSVSGMDIAFNKFSWRIYEASWTETYTLRGNIRTVGLSTGLVYSFTR